MKVILKAKINKLGNIGDIVVVKDGYAKNMLIPNGLAVFYTEKNYEIFKQKKEEIEKQNQDLRTKAESVKASILSKDLIVIENASDDGKLYGSVTTIKLAKFVNNLLKINFLKKTNIVLLKPIRTIGKFSILFNLHPEISFEKDLIVARSMEEAIKIKKDEFKLEVGQKKELFDEQQDIPSVETTEKEKKQSKKNVKKDEKKEEKKEDKKEEKK